MRGMERESRPSPSPPLVEIVGRDFPGANEVLVSFPERWECIEKISDGRGPLYVAGFPIERSFTGREHFEGLPREINVDLVFYRLYKFFQPWPMPQIVAEWNPREGEGRVVGDRGFTLQLQPIGQAQAWFGVNHAVLWECYFDESRRTATWQDTLAAVWSVVEKDLDVPKIFTPPHEPAFPEGYREFLTQLGYAQDADYPLWWGKQRIMKRRSIVTASVNEAPASVLEKDDPTDRPGPK